MLEAKLADNPLFNNLFFKTGQKMKASYLNLLYDLLNRNLNS